MDLKDIIPDETLDVRGISCPMPTLKAAKAMKNMAPGQILEVLGTDPGTKKDMPKLAATRPRRTITKSGRPFSPCLKSIVPGSL